VDISTLW